MTEEKRHLEVDWFILMNKYHSLIDKVYAHPNLLRAFRCGSRKRSRGSYSILWKKYRDNLPDNLMFLAQRLKTGNFRFGVPKSFYITGVQGKQLYIHVWGIEDFIVQHAIKQVLSPIFEKEFFNFVYGYRPGRGYAQAYMQALEFYSEMVNPWVVSTDIRNFFASIDRSLLKRLFCLRIADSKVINLVEQTLFSVDVSGLPLGNVLSPLMSNLYLYEIDKILCKRKIIRYCDNIIAFSQCRSNALDDLELITIAVQSVGLQLSDKKTRVVFAPSIESLFQ